VVETLRLNYRLTGRPISKRQTLIILLHAVTDKKDTKNPNKVLYQELTSDNCNVLCQLCVTAQFSVSESSKDFNAGVQSVGEEHDIQLHGFNAYN
jgi:hypothetical protein